MKLIQSEAEALGPAGGARRPLTLGPKESSPRLVQLLLGSKLCGMKTI